MRVAKRMALVPWLALLVVGCGGTLAPGIQRIPVEQYLFGTLGGAAIDLREVCRGGAARRASITRQPWMVLVGFITLGVYLPHEVEVSCDPHR